ncbi:MAG: amidohydrolase family protein [Deltaproteobacteria bacterium]|nr:amidohydrolase family protein [Deltaproteobacteria bacterium]MBW1956105.1 amidohydrolase family protein [Deltaproteobacteria bacterium]MBW2041836.1 amidohydrolase family protein [Deltaproteobacteria bacterium]MBW2133404.1 amidohydrolase family protein [Deltaproteobacteria bacterium]
MAVKHIYAGRLLDGTGGPVLKNVFLEIAGEKIRSISRWDPEKPIPEDGVDFSGCTLIPGLVDCHVHLCMSGTLDMTVREKQLAAGFQDATRTLTRHLHQHLVSGVTAVRDGGDRFGHTARYKRAGRIRPLIRLRVAGKAWHAPGRYGSLIGRPPEKGEPLARAVTRETEGVDWVKIVNSGINSLVQYGRQTLSQFDEKTLAAAAAAARGMGLPVMVHANGTEPVRGAVSARVKSIEHGYFMGTDNLKRMRDADVTWVPTVFAMKAFAAPEVMRQWVRTKDGKADSLASARERQSRDVAQRTLDHQLEQIREARELGVKIALGTDSGSMGVDHGASMKAEMGLLHEAGFSLPEIVHCAAGAGARLLGLSDSGILAPGKEATFAALYGTPDILLQSLCRITALWLRGDNLPLPGPETAL